MQVTFDRDPRSLESDTDIFLKHFHTPSRLQVASQVPGAKALKFYWVRPCEVVFFAWIVVNNPTYFNHMVFDLDGGRVNALERLQRFIDRTGISGTAVLSPNGLHFWVRIDPVYRRHSSSVDYYWAVWDNINRVLQGDLGYSGHSARNPEYGDAVRYEGWDRVYGLGELKQALGSEWESSNFLTRVKRFEGGGLGRNPALYSAVHGKVKETNDLDQVIQLARDLAPEFLKDGKPLPDAEVRAIALSVYRRRGQGGYGAETLARFGRKGGKKNSEAQREQREKSIGVVNADRSVKSQSRASEAHQLRRRGLTLRKVAEALSVSLATVKRYLSTAVRVLLDLNPANRKPRNTGPTDRVQTLARRLLGVKPIRIPAETLAEVNTS